MPLTADDLTPFTPRASHQAVLDVNEKVWIYGGYQLNNQGSKDLLKYDPRQSKFEEVKPVKEGGGRRRNKPTTRYDHSMVYYNEALYVFGGVVNQSFITNELWSFNISTLEWKLESGHDSSSTAIPSAVSGHTAHVINDEMYVVFGYNSFEGYIPRVQIYSFGNPCDSNRFKITNLSLQKLGKSR